MEKWGTPPGQSTRLLAFPAAALFCVLVFLCACSKKPEKDLFPAGAPMANVMRFEYAVYLLPGHTGDPSPLLRKVLAKKYPNLKMVEEIPKEPQGMIVRARVLENVEHEYAPPNLDSLKYSGYGLTPEQAKALQKSKEAFVLEFEHTKQNVWTGLRTADLLIEEIARGTGGLVWDEETREVFSPDAWHEKRLVAWDADVPDISSQTLIHIYKKKEYIRAITLGMAKVGLPDVVVDDFPWSSESQVGNLINLFCQSMAEGAGFAKPAKFRLDLQAIKNTKLREHQAKSLKTNSTGAACLSLKQGRWEEGDPKNRLIQLSAERYPGPDIQAKQERMISSVFGWEDAVTHVRHNDELLEVSRKARAKLPELHKAFDAGLQPGEFIEVKAPFKTPDGGNEWMWVEITSWKQDTIKGTLENEPFDISYLHSGQIVEVREEDVFDYIRQFPDKHREGNTTGEIIGKLDEEQNGKTDPAAGGEAPVPAGSIGCDPQ